MVPDDQIPGVHLIDLDIFSDDRGSFFEVFNLNRLLALVDREFSVEQINVSVSKKSVLRGMHYQAGEFAQAKLLRVIKGTIFDACVDLRRSSGSFGKWMGFKLDEKDMRVLYLPRGLAHGFCVLSEEAVIEYVTDNPYSPANEHCLIWDDPDVNIAWPPGHSFCLSAKDKDGKFLKDCETYE